MPPPGVGGYPPGSVSGGKSSGPPSSVAGPPTSGGPGGPPTSRGGPYPSPYPAGPHRPMYPGMDLSLKGQLLIISSAYHCYAISVGSVSTEI